MINKNSHDLRTFKRLAGYLKAGMTALAVAERRTMVCIIRAAIICRLRNFRVG